MSSTGGKDNESEWLQDSTPTLLDIGDPLLGISDLS
jgi:hypothetical protein